MKVLITYKKKELALDFPDNATVADLKKEFNKATRVPVPSQSFKYDDGSVDSKGKPKGIRYDDDKKTLNSYGYTQGQKLMFKDLGRQIGYRTVFVLEYLGPIVIMAIYALRPTLIFGEVKTELSDVAKMAIVSWIAHFAKREYETFFVHRFSRPYMPLSNLFKNCWYYWTFATLVGYFLCRPQYQPPTDPNFIYTGLVIFILAELGNLYCHVYLSGLRRAEGSKERPIPKGFGFDLVSCPNYTFEVTSWIGYSIMTGIVVSWVFTLVGFAQMLQWAIMKHKNYLETYGDEYKKLKRKAMVPLVI